MQYIYWINLSIILSTWDSLIKWNNLSHPLQELLNQSPWITWIQAIHPSICVKPTKGDINPSKIMKCHLMKLLFIYFGNGKIYSRLKKCKIKKMGRKKIYVGIRDKYQYKTINSLWSIHLINLLYFFKSTNWFQSPSNLHIPHFLSNTKSKIPLFFESFTCAKNSLFSGIIFVSSLDL